MSTLKTNNIEHLDASTPSIQTTIGGGTILAGVSTISGTLVVGGTDTSAKLNVFGGDIQIGTGLTFKSSSSTGNFNLQGGFTYPGGWIKLSGGSSDDNIVFGTSGNNAVKEERLRISSGGNIGIGTITPSDALTVYKSNTGNPTGITIRNTEASSTYSHARLRLESQNGAAYGEIWADVANAGLRLGYNSSSTVKIDTNGNIVFGNGKGIDFSATSDGSGTNTYEVLDDYETGNWTPVLKSSTNVITVTGTQNYYRYIKVGRLVTLFYCINNATTSGTTGGACTVAGLPFAPSASTQNNRFMSGDVMFYNTGFKLDAWPVYPHTATGDLFINFYEKGGSGAQYGSSNVNTVGSGSYFFFTFTYYTD